MDRTDYLVRVKCITYNHANYIVNAMDGFCMQKTDFPFLCTIVDDYSNDGEQEVIRRYLNDNFDLDDTSVARAEESPDYHLVFAQHNKNRNCFFLVYFLKYNHYTAKKPKQSYYDQSPAAKYIAVCEGDDYWVSPDKLQRQVSFLESHPDYVMTCSRVGLFSEKRNRIIGENYCYCHSRDISVKDVIYRGGLFISTCSIVYRREVAENRPDYWVKCRVGDYPLQIACVLKGKAWYFNDLMSVYRVDNPSSWMGSQSWSKGGADQKRKSIIESQLVMFQGFSADYPQYSSLFENKIADQINKFIPRRFESKATVGVHLNAFSNYIKNYSIKWKIDLHIRQCRLPYVRGLYEKVFMRHFHSKNRYY